MINQMMPQNDNVVSSSASPSGHVERSGGTSASPNGRFERSGSARASLGSHFEWSGGIRAGPSNAFERSTSTGSSPIAYFGRQSASVLRTNDIFETEKREPRNASGASEASYSFLRIHVYMALPLLSICLETTLLAKAMALERLAKRAMLVNT